MHTDDSPRGWATVLGMALASICSYSTTIAALSVLSLAAASISGHPALATLPGALMLATSGLLTYRVSLAMQRHGRRALFIAGALAGIGGGLLCLLALFEKQFLLLFPGVMLLGAFLSSSGYYRFTAAENVAPGQVPRAIAMVLAASLIAALAGSHVTALAERLTGPVPYAGALAIMVLAPAAALLPIVLTPMRQAAKASAGAAAKVALPLREVMAVPAIRLGLGATITGQMCMALMMQSTPLSMQGHGFALHESAHVIQWHVIGMFGPALFSGEIVKRWGARTTIVAGLVLFAISAAIALTDQSRDGYFTGLVMLGVAWNLLFTSGSSILGAIAEPALKASAQGLNETLVSFGSAATTASAAAILIGLGWNAVALLCLVLIIPLTWLVLAGWRDLPGS